MIPFSGTILSITANSHKFNVGSMFCRPELFPFSSCVFYAVVTSLVALDRVSLKKRVVDAPEILTVIEDVPNLAPLLNSLYMCSYSEFFQVCMKV